MASARKAISDLYRSRLLDVYFEGLNSIAPERLITKNVSIDKNKLLIKQSDSKSSPSETNLQTNNVHIVSFGKSAISLSKAFGHLVINANATESFRGGFVIAPSHLKERFNSDDRCVDIFEKLDLVCAFGAENNLPDERSVLATRGMLEFVQDTIKGDVKRGLRSTFVILFGGGGSACLTCPKFIDLNKKLELIRFLQRKGADIIELNKVRRFFSHVKGGKLAKYMLNQGENVDVISLIVSDVIGNPLEFIASGPTFLGSDDDKSGIGPREDMISVLKKYGYCGVTDLFKGVASNLRPKHDDNCKIKDDSRIKNLIIGDNSVAIESAANKAREMSFDVDVIGNSWQGCTEEILNSFIDYHQGGTISRGKEYLVIGGGEATIKSEVGDTWGTGGRCQEMGLDYLIENLSRMNQIGDGQGIEIFFAATTDGQDGSTDVAACLVSPSDILLAYKSRNGHLDDIEIVDKLRLKATEAKRSHNSNQFWSEISPDSLIKIGLTETNVMDLYMLMVAK